MTDTLCASATTCDPALKEEKHVLPSAKDSCSPSESPNFGDSIMEQLSSSDAGCRRDALLKIISDRVTGHTVKVMDLMLLDESVEVRALAAHTLDRLGEGAATPALLRALGDSHFSVRSAAGWALLHLGAGATGEVRSLLETSCDPNAREMAELILERLATPSQSDLHGNVTRAKLSTEVSAVNLGDIASTQLPVGSHSNESDFEKLRKQLLLHLEYEHDMGNALGPIMLALRALAQTPLTNEQEEIAGDISGCCERLRTLLDESAKSFRSSGILEICKRPADGRVEA